MKAHHKPLHQNIRNGCKKTINREAAPVKLLLSFLSEFDTNTHTHTVGWQHDLPTNNQCLDKHLCKWCVADAHCQANRTAQWIFLCCQVRVVVEMDVSSVFLVD